MKTYMSITGMVWFAQGNEGIGAAGFIPQWLDTADPRSAAEQLNAAYQHGGGWSPFHGFKTRDNYVLTYPGDPPLHPLAWTNLRNETVVIYRHGWVAIFQLDGTFEVCRMD